MSISYGLLGCHSRGLSAGIHVFQAGLDPPCKPEDDKYQEHGNFCPGSIGGPAALLAEENIKEIECIDYPELGMEAVRKMEVVDFPAFVLVDDTGNDLYKKVAS